MLHIIFDQCILMKIITDNLISSDFIASDIVYSYQFCIMITYSIL